MEADVVALRANCDPQQPGQKEEWRAPCSEAASSQPASIAGGMNPEDSPATSRSTSSDPGGSSTQAGSQPGQAASPRWFGEAALEQHRVMINRAGGDEVWGVALSSLSLPISLRLKKGRQSQMVKE